MSKDLRWPAPDAVAVVVRIAAKDPKVIELLHQRFGLDGDAPLFEITFYLSPDLIQDPDFPLASYVGETVTDALDRALAPRKPSEESPARLKWVGSQAKHPVIRKGDGYSKPEGGKKK
jgi:hypothetical protein